MANGIRDIGRKWYDRLTELGYTQHVVAAMDERLFDALAALDIAWRITW